MNITVFEEIEQTKALIRELDQYCFELEHYIIVAPMDAINDAIYHGLPREYANMVEVNYNANVAVARSMIIDIRENHIPYWQSRIKILEDSL